jgi:hypothetical protein
MSWLALRAGVRGSVAKRLVFALATDEKDKYGLIIAWMRRAVLKRTLRNWRGREILVDLEARFL